MSKQLFSPRSPHREIAGRLRAIRVELFGEDGVPELARRLGLPERTWRNYEAGVTIPGEVLLKFMVLTSTEPSRLLGRPDPEPGGIGGPP